MDPSLRQWQAFLALSLLALYAFAWAGEPTKAEPKGEPAKAESKPDPAKTEPAKVEPGKTEPKAVPQEEPKLEPMPVGPEGRKPVAKVDSTEITRAELTMARRQIALNQRGPMPSNDQILDQLIEQALWQRHFDKEGIRPTVDEIKAALQQTDAELRQRGATYPQFLQSRGLTVEEHASMVGRQIAMQRLVDKIRQKIASEEIKAEYEAHPEFYDGSRVRLSQIYIDTRTLGTEQKDIDKAKEKIEKLSDDLKAGKDFATLAKDYSAGRTAAAGGDIGWFTRKGDIDEPLIAAVWTLKVGDYTKPIRNALGWHILKVADRETAYSTFQGCKEGIYRALIRNRLDAILEGLKKDAKIEKYI